MDWFKGEVIEAIQACRQRNVLFIVYIYDNSADSKSTDAAWESDEVAELMKYKKCVGLKIAKDTTEHKQFSQLYPVFLLPCVFCIGRTGQHLLIMNGAQTKTQLKAKLQEAFQKYDDEQNTPNSTNQVQGVGPTEDAAAQPPGASDNGSSKPEMSKEMKINRYQEKIKERRRERAEEEFQKEKQQELSRREYGKSVGQQKQEREQVQNRQWLKERQKQKEEARLAREEVRAKLEQDKLERQSRQRNFAADSQQKLLSSSQESAASVSPPLSTSGKCRIQLRLPSGGNNVLELNRSDTLRTLRERVSEELNEHVENVVLSSTYPRKELGNDLDSQSMVQLQLVPSGVVFVRVNKKSFTLSSSSSGEGSGGIIVGTLTQFIQFLVYCLSLIKKLLVSLFGGGSGAPNESSSKQQQPEINRPSVNANTSSTGLPVPSGTSDGLRVRKFRQEDYQDNSDDEGTYNGNSTQQQ